MVTRARSGIIKHNPKYALTVMSANIPREPHNIWLALAHPGWIKAMEEEFDALH